MNIGNSISAIRAHFQGSRSGTTLLRGSIGALCVQVLGAVLAFAVHLVLARALGTEEYGIYALTLSWVTLLTVFALVGQDTSVIRFLPAYAHRTEWGKLKALLRGTALMVLTTSFLLALLVLLVINLLQPTLGESLVTALIAGLVLLPILTQLQLSGAMHRGLKRAVSSGIFNSVLRPILLISAILIISYGFGQQLTASFVLILSAIAALLAFIASSYALRSVWPRRAKTAHAQYELSGWLTVGTRLLLVAAIGMTMRKADVLLLGGLSGTIDVGPYFAAVQLAAVAGFGLNSVNTILAPMISQHYAANEQALLAHVVRLGAQLAFVITTCASLPLVLFGHWALGLFGPNFVAAYPSLLLILAAQCFNAATGPVGYLLAMTKFERRAPLVFGSGAVLNVLFGLLLVPRFGMLGAAIGSAVSTVTWNIAALVIVRRNLRINPTVFSSL